MNNKYDQNNIDFYVVQCIFDHNIYFLKNLSFLSCPKQNHAFFLLITISEFIGFISKFTKIVIMSSLLQFCGL